MKQIAGILAGLVLISGCGDSGSTKPEAASDEPNVLPTPAEPAVPAPSATPPPTSAVMDVPADAEVAGIDDAEPMVVETVATVDLDPATIENQRVREEVLKRVDVMPTLTPEEKDRLYVSVDRARAMGKVITLPFRSGSMQVAASEIDGLEKALAEEGVKEFTDDPTVVFVVLGFADKVGNSEANLRISQTRADAALALLKDRFGLLNVMHAVGMGSSEMFDAENLDKNRVVEIWAVLP